jgi:predicted RNA-binding protein with PUA-like domain
MSPPAQAPRRKAAAAAPPDSAGGSKKASKAEAPRKTAPTSPTPTATTPSYWLVKSEPHVYSVDDLAALKGGGMVGSASCRSAPRALARALLCCKTARKKKHPRPLPPPPPHTPHAHAHTHTHTHTHTHAHTTPTMPPQWDGVRNYSARNNMRAMKRGDLCLFYHSSCPVPAVVAVAEVTREAYPDPTALDPSGEYYDAKHTEEAPRWFCVDLRLERRVRRAVTLADIKARAAAAAGGGERSALAGMALLTRPRLSVQPVTEAEWREVMRMEQEEGEEDGDGEGEAKCGRVAAGAPAAKKRKT